MSPVRRSKVRDGVIAAEYVEVNVEGMPASEVARELRELASFQSLAERLESHSVRLRDAACGEGPRARYAEQALRYFGWVASDLAKVADAGERRRAEGLLLDLLRGMESAWRVDVKQIEPEIVTGAKSRRGSRKGNSAKAAEATAKHEAWQAKAEAIWRKNPLLSPRDVARRIDPERWDYIRKRITKP